MKRTTWLRKNHKWLALVSGLQVFVWAISGLYMVSVNIDIIHGDHLVKTTQVEAIGKEPLTPISEQVISRIESIKSIQLTRFFGTAFYRINSLNGISIVDAKTGHLALTLPRERIKEITKQIYAGDASILSIELLSDYPSELRSKDQPIWRVTFDDIVSSTLYFHYQTGQLVSKRTDLWRTFDFLWKLHIIEYFGFDGYVGWIFRLLSILSLAMAILGSFLLYYRLKSVAQQ